MLKNMLENHDLFQLSGIIGIVVTYVLVVIFNTVNGIGGKMKMNDSGILLPKLSSPTLRKNCSSDREKLLQKL